MTKKTRPQFFYGYIVVFSGAFILMIIWGAFYTFGIFFKPLSGEFGWTRAMTSGAFSLHTFVFGLFAIVMGRLTDRFGPRIVMVVCGLLLGSGYLLMSQVKDLWQLYLFYGVIIGIAMGASFIPIVSTIPRWFVTRRAMMMGITLSGIGLGAVIMPPFARWLISGYGWQSSYVVVGTMVSVLIISFAQFLRREPAQNDLLPYGGNDSMEASRGSPEKGFSLREALCTRQLWMFCLMYVCHGFYIMTIAVHIVPHITDLKIAAKTAANILSFIGGISILGRVALGNAADRLGNKKVLIGCLSTVALSLLWLPGAGELWMFYLFAVIYGLFYSGLDIVSSPMLADLFGVGSLGSILGAMSISFTTGGAIGPVMAGHIFDVTGSYEIAFLICAVLVFVALGVAYFLKPIIPKPLTLINISG
jgi:MFS family permease